MRPWRDCNTLGRCMIVCSIINVLIAVKLALVPNYLCFFSLFMAMYCGLITYNKKYTANTCNHNNEG